jgi:methionine-rich copper-binding protein CopC
MRKLSLLAAISLFSILGQTNAYSHSSVVKTIPQYKSTLSALPDQVSIRFSEEPLVMTSEVINSITVINPQGEVISDSLTKVFGKSLIVGIREGQHEKGSYEVRYRMASGDGHVISGNYEFYLGHPSEKSSGNLKESADDQQWWGEHFLHLHRDHIIYTAGVLVVAIGLLIWRRRVQSH